MLVLGPPRPAEPAHSCPRRPTSRLQSSCIAQCRRATCVHTHNNMQLLPLSLVRIVRVLHPICNIPCVGKVDARRRNPRAQCACGPDARGLASDRVLTNTVSHACTPLTDTQVASAATVAFAQTQTHAPTIAPTYPPSGGMSSGPPSSAGGNSDGNKTEIPPLYIAIPIAGAALIILLVLVYFCCCRNTSRRALERESAKNAKAREKREARQAQR